MRKKNELQHCLSTEQKYLLAVKELAFLIYIYPDTEENKIKA